MKLNVFINYQGTVHEIETHQNQYRSLMMLIFDRIGPDGFGECLGMGKCATCLVEVLGEYEQLTGYERNETATLARHGIDHPRFRLSCQIQIDKNINGLKFRII